MRRPSRTRAASSVPAAPLVVTVVSLGAQGDGVAEADGRRLYIPFTAPGDRVRVRIGARRGDGFAASLGDILDPSPDRRPAFCPHFGSCGGCALQHVATAAWKRRQVVDALARRGLSEAPVAETRSVPPATRRRAALALDGRQVGFVERAGRRVVDVEACPLLVPALAAVLPALRGVAAGRGQMLLTAAAEGCDAVLATPRPPDPGHRRRLASLAEEAGLARLSWRPGPDDVPEPLLVRALPHVVLAGVAVPLPAGAFLQPSAEGEAILQALVAGGVAGAGRVADLFAGLGTFALGLATAAHVHAAESDAEAVRALTTAAGRAGLGGRLTAEIRDLDRQPLSIKELNRFEAVVFDPPRAGAAAQVETLAAARSVIRVVAVSCNPATFARDARTLVDGGFRLETATPVDQFPFAAHVEVVGVFRRP